MGCQMNEYDSDFLAQSLIQSGLLPVDDPGRADLILINTCTVREKPEQKAFSMFGRMARIKRRNPDLVLGVVGCLAQQMGAGMIKRFPQIDFVMGPRKLGRIHEILEQIYSGRTKIVATGLEAPPPQPTPCRGYFKGRVTSFISIMEGCNNFCSYCTVPYVRGREISRSPDEILIEAGNLISEGVKEITLLGQNVNSYRWNEDGGGDFISLLKKLNKLEGLLRLRFTTSHPKDLSDGLIECFADLDKLCPHIHLPFQAGSNPVLKRMKRGYTREEYMERIAKLRKVKPDIAITSDVMVGFPGESKDDFEMTLDLIKRVQFDGLFSFKYSDRKGTLADKMGNKVGETEKSFRLSMLQGLQKQITLKKNKNLEGKRMDVLIEGHSKREGQLKGRTESNKIVNLICDTNNIGHLVNVIIKHGFLNSLRGEVT
ncbi:MAG: tRNA (N6-isopentenyl adenosine(37)-C2)-methylthiotransferase MiaB [Deltaproteobacteria bacterium]|nr:tRNA (N6-isopentenyl adenosine(37)-C2)-methylthiotransferase MiaB [Deltaproteobacteria bacterium]